MMDLDRALDNWIETAARRIARQSSRRHFISLLGSIFVGGAALPLLPVARVAASEEDPGNPQDCGYWRYCGFDGFMCSHCGGTQSMCPPGTELSKVTWVGTCINPGDGKAYVISYNDCCGKSTCGRGFCNRNEGEEPIYRPSRNNDINWCHGTTTNLYHCTIAAVIGTADSS